MKLLYISYGGLTDNQRIFYPEYVRQGVDLTVIVPSSIPVNKTYSCSGFLTYSHKYDEKGYRFVPVGLIKPNYIDSFKPFQLYKAIKQIKPDIIHVYNDYSSLHLTQAIICRNILYSRKIPVVVRVFQNVSFKSSPFAFSFSLDSIKKNINKILHPLIFAYHKKNIDGITSMNTDALENIKSMDVDVPMKRIFTGIDLKNFYPNNTNSCREKIGIPKNIKLVGYFGRIIKEKGLNKLVKAISKIDGCHLMLIGSGYDGDDYENSLNKLIDSLGIRHRIYRFESIKQDNLVDYYNCLDAFVLSSQTTRFWKEQYGLVLAEAMACHVPIVGSSSGAIPEVLNGYPKHLIFKEDSVDDLVNKINKVMDLEFPKNFDINKFLYKKSIGYFIAAHINFYKNLLSKNG